MALSLGLSSAFPPRVNSRFQPRGVCKFQPNSRVSHHPVFNLHSQTKLGFKLQVACMSSESGKVSEGGVLEAVSQIIAKQLTVDPSTVKPDSKFVELGMDSLDTVEIMMSIEDQFNISLPEQGAEKVTTVQEAVNIVKDVLTK